MLQARGRRGILVQKPKGKKPLGRPRRRREDNIRMNIRRCSSMDWIHFARDRDSGGLL
jgi:hypothetical protein